VLPAPTVEPSCHSDSRLSIPMAGLVLFVMLFLLYDYAAYFLPASIQIPLTYVYGAALLLIALVNLPLGLLVFVVSLIFADDISRMAPTSGATDVHSLMTVPVAGISLGNLVAAGIVALGLFFALLGWSREPRQFHVTVVDVSVLGIVGLYALALLHGIHWLSDNLRGTINDLQFPIIGCGLYFAVRFHTRTEEELARLMKYTVLAAGAKALVWAAWALLGIGEQFGTTIRVSFESGRILLVLVLAYGLVLQSPRLNVGRWARLIALFLAACAGFNILIHAGRMAWLFAAFACLVLLVLGEFRDKARWLAAGAVCGAVLVAGALTVRPQIFGTLGDFARTLRVWDIHSFSASRSSMVRVYEFANIHAHLSHRSNLILGEGPGSHFTDRYYPFPFRLAEDDYSFQEIESRRFQEPHGLLQNLLLNTGYGGTSAYLAFVFIIYTACYAVYRKTGRPPLKAQALVLLAFLPAMVYTTWTAKTNMLLGICLGLAGGLYAIGRISETAKGTSDN